MVEYEQETRVCVCVHTLNIKVKGLFWFTYLEVSPKGQLALLLLVCGKIAHTDRGSPSSYGWIVKKRV